MNNPRPTKLVQPVTVRRHRVDWESDVLQDATAQRVMSLGSKLESGCWYLNARFTVSSPVPTAEFFAKVKELRSSWLRTCRQSLGNHGQRMEARKAERRGRFAAITEVNQSGETISSSQSQLNSPGLSGLTVALWCEVIQAGRTAKNLAFGGVLFINGKLIAPRIWQAMADEG